MIAYAGPSLLTRLADEQAEKDKLQQDIKSFVEEIAEKDAAGCAFWACPGPDEEPVGMATCHHCGTVWDARQLLKRIEGKA